MAPRSAALRMVTFDRWLVVIAIATFALALPPTVSAEHGAGQDTIHKEVVAINGEPRTDPDDPSDPISVTQGDTVTYRISVTAGAEGANAEATIEDNFTPSEQEFVDATGADCSLSEEGDGTKLTCEVTLDEDGAATVDAAFRMVAEAPEEGEGCPTVQNVATVRTQDFEPRPSNQTMVEVCAPEPTPTPEPTPAPTATPTPDDGAGALPDTATDAIDATPTAVAVLVLLVLAGLGAMVKTSRGIG